MALERSFVDGGPLVLTWILMVVKLIHFGPRVLVHVRFRFRGHARLSLRRRQWFVLGGVVVSGAARRRPDVSLRACNQRVVQNPRSET